MVWWALQESNLVSPKRAELQSAAVANAAQRPKIVGDTSLHLK